MLRIFSIPPPAGPDKKRRLIRLLVKIKPNCTRAYSKFSQGWQPYDGAFAYLQKFGMHPAHFNFSRAAGDLPTGQAGTRRTRYRSVSHQPEGLGFYTRIA
jgi:hypothetical protein